MHITLLQVFFVCLWVAILAGFVNYNVPHVDKTKLQKNFLHIGAMAIGCAYILLLVMIFYYVKI